MLLPIAAHRGTGASCGASNSFQLHRVRQPQPHTLWPLRCSAQPRGSSTAALVDPRMAAALRARRPPTERSRNHAIGHAGLDGASCHRRLRSVAHGLRQRLLPEPRRSHLISTVSVAVISSEIFRTGGLTLVCGCFPLFFAPLPPNIKPQTCQVTPSNVRRGRQKGCQRAA